MFISYICNKDTFDQLRNILASLCYLTLLSLPLKHTWTRKKEINTILTKYMMKNYTCNWNFAEIIFCFDEIFCLSLYRQNIFWSYSASFNNLQTVDNAINCTISYYTCKSASYFNNINLYKDHLFINISF